MNLEKRLIDMTLGELLDVLSEREARLRADIVESSRKQQELPKIVYGLDGIAKLFNCSKSTAYRIKHSGIISDAIMQYNRTFCVNVDKALSLYNKTQQN